MIEGKITRISGPIVYAEGLDGCGLYDVVDVGEKKLIGEIIRQNKGNATIQVYEEDTGMHIGEKVVCTQRPLSLRLGPGLVGNIYDGIQRPLKSLFSGEDKQSQEDDSAFLIPGQRTQPLDETKLWQFDAADGVGEGTEIYPGFVLGTVKETESITQKIMVPPETRGRKLVSFKGSGTYTINDVIAKTEFDEEIYLAQYWAVRKPRPYHEKLGVSEPLITGQRVIDVFFPLSKGGTAAIPGGFGTGKTMTQHAVAKWCDADLIVYIGCGERGNEMTEVLTEFPELIDPRTGRSIMERTILIANTSNMPVAAREASIYTGITLAEYYRDMGYDVAIMADSTSRWAEALREISGRLEEMPAEEGFPPYLPSKLSAFYERAGRAKTLGENEGSVTIIGAVSPQGSDFSEPVTQNTKRFVRCFWALDKSLAYARHYPAINWINSYSEYFGDLDPWYIENFGEQFIKYRKKIASILSEEDKLMEIVKLVGADVLPDDQKLIIEIAKVIRVGFLQQNAFHKDDTFVPLQKQKLMMKIVLYLNKKVRQLISASIPISKVIETGIFDKLTRIKYDIPNDKLELFEDYKHQIDETLEKIIRGKI